MLNSFRFEPVFIHILMEFLPKLGGIAFLLPRVLPRDCYVITLFHLRLPENLKIISL